jgi:hypothetical protein
MNDVIAYLLLAAVALATTIATVHGIVGWHL